MKKTIPFRRKYILEWVKQTFGTGALNKKERAARVVEEAIELAQVCGLDAGNVLAITDRVFERPAGTYEQEIAGVQITLEALAEMLHYDIDIAADREFFRILRLPPDHFKDKYRDKRSQAIVFFPEVE